MVFNRLSWLGCSLSKDAFLEIEDAFQLTPDTLPSLFAQNGTCSRRLIYDGDRIARVGVFHTSRLISSIIYYNDSHNSQVKSKISDRQLWRFLGV
jgi:hypothetical protein